MKPEIYMRLSDLLPRLSAVTDRRRLQVLSDIDRVLAKEGMTWADIAGSLTVPRDEWDEVKSDVLLAMIDCIEAGDVRSINAAGFLKQVREEASTSDAVSLSPRQGAWLYRLYEKAAKEQQDEKDKNQRPKTMLRLVHNGGDAA